MIAAAGATPWTLPKTKSIELTTVIGLWLCVLFIPMKGLALQVGGQSIYVPYMGLGLCSTLLVAPISKLFLRHFMAPMAAIAALSVFYYAQTGFQTDVFIFGAKIGVLFAMSALYIHLLGVDERAVMTFLFYGAAVSIAYMVYQGVSVELFGSSLPFTSIESLQIGRGIGSRYGLVRTTGFTEEPSYIAVMLLGTALMLRSYGIRSGESQTKRQLVLLVGLLLCTSNNLFATLPILLVFSLFYVLRAPFLFFVAFYVASILVTPAVIGLDETFFARFSSYGQFLELPWSQRWLGIGFNQYASFPFPVFLSPEGLPTLVVDSIASLWGGVLLEGGIVFATLFCLYLSRLTQLAKDSTGYALMAILIMLANYYSPWWPIVSLALAYTIYSRQPRTETAR